MEKYLGRFSASDKGSRLCRRVRDCSLDEEATYGDPEEAEEDPEAEWEYLGEFSHNEYRMRQDDSDGSIFHLWKRTPEVVQTATETGLAALSPTHDRKPLTLADLNQIHAKHHWSGQ